MNNNKYYDSLVENFRLRLEKYKNPNSDAIGINSVLSKTEFRFKPGSTPAPRPNLNHNSASKIEPRSVSTSESGSIIVNIINPNARSKLEPEHRPVSSSESNSVIVNVVKPEADIKPVFKPSSIKFYDSPPVPDLLSDSMRILFIGNNPDLHSSESNAHFASPKNTFWEVLFETGMTLTKFSYKDEKTLLEEYGFGFAYICKRPTEIMREVSKEEYIEGSTILKKKIQEYRPQVCCFLGPTIYKYFFDIKYNTKIEMGFQSNYIEHLEKCKIFVLPVISSLTIPYIKENAEHLIELNNWIIENSYKAEYD
ncbi:DNA glycosylase [Conidiobolus coronatus NRRL 28638]|uniref:DNA glycosylase n=1 Tax=Conidiobolus coronatus (strain ATCC 28846 / CBS 209.66 / NRRL 28638) TaxID=796925 RepID=A0A137P2C1_CONC2|nr:DNA glycosylase [Conidiobolus coronatus NRRL 28638]|eukprot:KXN69195.1 DNA glycosylase [Conidiobolus coronatus NRRL 28638]